MLISIKFAARRDRPKTRFGAWRLRKLRVRRGIGGSRVDNKSASGIMGQHLNSDLQDYSKPLSRVDESHQPARQWARVSLGKSDSGDPQLAKIELKSEYAGYRQHYDSASKADRRCKQ